VYDRNDRRRRSGGLGERDPDLGSTAGGAVVAGLALEAAGVDHRGERTVDLAGFLLRLKRSRTSVRLMPWRRSLARAQMSSAVGSPRLSPKTQSVESRGVAPEAERGVEVREVDRGGAVKEGVDQRESDPSRTDPSLQPAPADVINIADSLT